MVAYIYLAILSIVLVCSISRKVYLFKKDKYNPYPFRKEKKKVSDIVDIGIMILIFIGPYLFIKNVELLSILTVIFLCYSFCLIVSISVLNYLSYMKIKDKNIIIHTVTIDMMIIVISTCIFKYTMGLM